MKPAIVVLGCGYWGKNHVKTLKQLGHLYGVCDINMAKAQELASLYETKAITIDDLFTCAAIDAVVLALPANLHSEIAIKALNHGKHVFVEKPMALSVQEALKLVACAKEKELLVMVGHILRYHPVFEMLEQYIKADAIGAIKYIDAKRWGFGKFHAKSDAMWDLAPHDLSLILALSKEMPETIELNGSGILAEGFDFTQINLYFSAMKASLNVSRLSPYCDRKFMVVGSKAIILWDDAQSWDKKLALYGYKIEMPHGECSEAEYIKVDEAQPLMRELQHFIASIQTKQKPRTDACEGLAIAKILDRAN